MNGTADIVFIGGEPDASGYRLAGARVICPEPDETRSVLQGLLEAQSTLMIVLGAAYAGHVDQAYLANLMMMFDPLVIIVSPMQQPSAGTGLQESLRSMLGVHQAEPVAGGLESDRLQPT